MSRRDRTVLAADGTISSTFGRRATIIYTVPSEAGHGRPTASTPAVSAFMSRLKRSGTKPELELRRELHRLGLRFRVNVKDLPGRPDVVFSRARIAVFVDGC